MPDCPDCGLNIPRKITAFGDEPTPKRVLIDYCPACGTKLDS